MLESFRNIVYDTNYSQQVPGGGYPVVPQLFAKPENQDSQGSTNPKSDTDSAKSSTRGWFSKIFSGKKKDVPQASGSMSDTKQTNTTDAQQDTSTPGTGENTDKESVDAIDSHAGLKQQIQQLIALPDEKYSDKLLTSELRKFILDNEKQHNSNIADYKSHIAPSYWKVEGSRFNIAGLFGKSFYVEKYPSYIESLWTRDIMSFDGKWDMSFFVYPEDDSGIQSVLKTKATQIKAEINEAIRKGVTVDTELEVQYRDIQTIRQKLATREERYYETGGYITMYHPDKQKLQENGKKLEQKISGLGIRMKSAYQRMDEGFSSTIPLCQDQLGITRSTITSSLAGSFPFISTDMMSSTGIFYGINQHTGSLVIFDRFNNELPNMNSVILATSGAGKSFTVKLEILRYLLNDVEAIVIDPENEYVSLAEKVGGTYINIATNSDQHINPFDLPPKLEDREYGKGDLLRGQIANLIGLITILVGGLSPAEEAILDNALQTTYQLRGITMNMDDYTGKQIPLMEDLYNVLQGMQGEEAAGISLRLSKFVSGAFAKIFNNRTNVDINNKMTVFSIRDLEDSLKTPAMYNALNFIRAKVRSHKRKRLLVADEAWIMLQNEISANFMFGLIKRARKYGLGITTISQDIEDFTRSPYGKPIISNSAVQILLKQSTTSIKTLESLIGLSEAEKQRLVAASIGEGLLFAGNKHVAVKIMAAPHEKAFISTDLPS